jgi:hypothetical protein
MINFDGVPIWSQSGLGSESIAGFSMTNTHNPAVQQNGDLLLQTYIRPPILNNMLVKAIFSHKVRFFWPMNYFDEHQFLEYQAPGTESLDYNSWAAANSENPQSKSNGGSDKSKQKKNASISSIAKASFKSTLNFIKPSHSKSDRRKKQTQNTDSMRPTKDEERRLQSESKVWCIGRRNDAFVAVCCTKPIIYEDSETDDANFQETKESPKKSIPRLYCNDAYHSWVVVVGTVEEYATMNDFIHERIRKIVIEEKYEDNLYQMRVLDLVKEKSLFYVYDTVDCEALI